MSGLPSQKLPIQGLQHRGAIGAVAPINFRRNTHCTQPFFTNGDNFGYFCGIGIPCTHRFRSITEALQQVAFSKSWSLEEPKMTPVFEKYKHSMFV